MPRIDWPEIYAMMLRATIPNTREEESAPPIQERPVAFKCSGCNAPMMHGELKCRFCGTEYTYAPGAGRLHQKLPAPTTYFV
jgi:uncharacterized Zn-finger protein